MIKVPHIVAFPTVFLFWKIEDLRIAQSYVKQSFLSIFGSGGSFPHDFGQIQGDHTVFIRNQENIFYSYVPNCFCFCSRQGGVLKYNKNGSFSVFLAVWVVFPKFSGRLRSSLY